MRCKACLSTTLRCGRGGGHKVSVPYRCGPDSCCSWIRGCAILTLVTGQPVPASKNNVKWATRLPSRSGQLLPVSWQHCLEELQEFSHNKRFGFTVTVWNSYGVTLLCWKMEWKCVWEKKKKSSTAVLLKEKKWAEISVKLSNIWCYISAL